MYNSLPSIHVYASKITNQLKNEKLLAISEAKQEK